jgi:2-polyprenyl-6-methoxyphenol hydroxylase-like FAD-dependent oxidoreductase
MRGSSHRPWSSVRWPVESSAHADRRAALAGDAAGFIDPMTGDGLRFAVQGGELAAAGGVCRRSNTDGPASTRGSRPTTARAVRASGASIAPLRALVSSAAPMTRRLGRGSPRILRASSRGPATATP